MVEIPVTAIALNKISTKSNGALLINGSRIEEKSAMAERQIIATEILLAFIEP